MSGSSLDGLDIAYATMEWADAAQTDIKWSLHAAETLPFSELWQTRLRDLPKADALAFARTHTYFGYYMAELVQAFLQKNGLKNSDIDLVSSHGQTIFQQPDRRFTTQIGCGAALAAVLQCDVACDFRTHDIALNGEGTPLAPIADKHLFGGYDFYVNLGGIANISCNLGEQFVAFDTGAANQILNRLANQIGLEYDKNGENARNGNLQQPLLDALAALPYHAQPFPKSLSNQWVQQVVGTLVDAYDAPINDKLHTVCVHIAAEIARAAAACQADKRYIQRSTKEKTPQLFLTGGGALNTFLVAQIRAALAPDIALVLPEKQIIDFKEALLMCVLGFLRIEKRTNTMASVTGAKRDTIGGALYCR